MSSWRSAPVSAGCGRRGTRRSRVTAEQKLRDLVARVPAGTPAEMRLTHGSIADAVLAVGHEVEADLVVLSTRATTDPGDGSVTDRVLQSATLPIFAMHDAQHDHRTPRFATATERQPLLVPTDLTPASQPAVDVAFDLARRFAFDVHLLHVLPRGATDGEAAAHAHRMMAALAPPDLPRPLEEHIETGIPARAIALPPSRFPQPASSWASTHAHRCATGSVRIPHRPCFIRLPVLSGTCLSHRRRPRRAHRQRARHRRHKAGTAGTALIRRGSTPGR